MKRRSLRNGLTSRVDRDEGRRFSAWLDGDLRLRRPRFETLESRLLLAGDSFTVPRECLTELLALATPGLSIADAQFRPAASSEASVVLRTAPESIESTALPATPSVFATTALDTYVAAPDASFGWTFVTSFSGQGYDVAVLQMTSQEWRTSAEVDRTLWKHWLTLIVPNTITSDTALLFINGGNNNSSPPAAADPLLVHLAVATGTIVADLRMVPNQPLGFAGDGDGGVETAGTFIVPGQPGEQVQSTFRFEEDNGGYQSKFGFYDVSAVSADPVLEKRDFAVQAIGNGTLLFDDALVNPGATVTITLPAGMELGFYLIPNDTPANFLANPDAFYGPLAYRPAPLFSRPAANPGQFDQMLASIGNGSSLFSFEDRTRIPGGGSDGDFNDIKFSIDVELIPVPLPPGEAEVVYGPGRSEDAMIAFSFDQFMATGDETWPALLPMVKSAVRAMDVVQEVVPLALGIEVNSFVVSGGSKRGWTTWLTAAVDALAPEPRVKAIIPAVIDVLNFNAQLDHHEEYYEGVTDAIIDGFSSALQDYTALDVIERRNTPEGQALAAIVDPYAYRDRLTMPKFIVNSTGDEFFVPDSSQFYLDDLLGQNYLRYVPNTGHGVLNGSDAGESILAFYRAIVNDEPLPEFSWSLEDGGTQIRVTTVDAPLQVNVWQATNYASRDFRRSVTGIPWESAPLVDQGGGVYVAHVAQPNIGATAFMVELVFASGGPVPFKFTTQVSVLSAVEQPPIEPSLVPLLLKDVNAVNLSSSISDMTAVAGTLFFTVFDTATGRELWKSDGTAEGTVLVKDILVGTGSSYPGSLKNVNGTLYFSANDGVHGSELWKSDGTAEGTMLVADIRPVSSYGYNAGSSPYNLTDVNGMLFFSAYDGVHGSELWKSDGTAEGTVLVADIRPVSPYGYNPGSNPHNLTDVGGTLYFSANDGVHGYELWTSDGTAEGTMLVANIRPDSPYGYGRSSYPQSLTGVGGMLFFSANDGAHGYELWKSDGTAEGTMLVANIRSDPYGYGRSSYPGWLTNVGGTLFFTANDEVHGNELWTSDGTAEGTILVANILPDSPYYGYGRSSYPQYLTDVGGTLFFTAYNDATGRELWKNEGTAEGTMLVANIQPDSPYGYGRSSYPQQLTSVGGTLFFTAFDDATGRELWKSDGTGPGTALVKDIATGGASAYPYLLTAVGGTLFFVADDRAHGYELWKSDGASAATQLVEDINRSTPGSEPQELVVVDGMLFFTADDGIHGQELWKSDGTAAGTALVADIWPGINSGQSHQLTAVGGTLYFVANDGVHGNELWKSDGTAEGTVLVANIRPDSPYGYGRGSYANQLTSVGGTLYFVADDGVHGRELWTSDGTVEGTVLVANIRSDPYGYGRSSYPDWLTNVGGTLFFRAHDGVHGYELWTSDGTAEGTILVANIRPDSPYYGRGSYPGALTNVGGTLFFTANDGAHGYELWKSDGTAEGTVLVKDIGPVSSYGYNASSSPSNLTDVNGTLFFTAYDNMHGRELWTSDGTAEGTVLVKDFANGSSYPSDLTNVDGTLFFTAYHNSLGRELWTSDGTAAGTVPVKNIAPGTGSSYPRYLTDVNGTLYFSAYDFTNGQELWQSDGTAAGTVMVADTMPGLSASYPNNLRNFDGTLFFTANSPTMGREPWLLVRPVTIDIRPGDSNNTVNPNSRGALPVVVFSSDEFDAATIDPATLTLSGAPVRLRGNGTPQASLDDFNGDGLTDLMVFFATESMQVSSGDTVAVLDGKQLDGQRIHGADAVRIVGGGNNGNGNQGGGNNGTSSSVNGTYGVVSSGRLRMVAETAAGADVAVETVAPAFVAIEAAASPVVALAYSGPYDVLLPPRQPPEATGLGNAATVAHLAPAASRAASARVAATDAAIATWIPDTTGIAESLRAGSRRNKKRIDAALADPVFLLADKVLVGQLASLGTSTRSGKK